MGLPPVINIDKILSEMPSDDLFELAEQVESLQAQAGWARLQDIVEDARTKARQSLEMGPIREQADYTRWLGFINGFGVQSDIVRQITAAASDRRAKLEHEAAAERERREPAAVE